MAQMSVSVKSSSSQCRGSDNTKLVPELKVLSISNTTESGCSSLQSADLTTNIDSKSRSSGSNRDAKAVRMIDSVGTAKGDVDGSSSDSRNRSSASTVTTHVTRSNSTASVTRAASSSSSANSSDQKPHKANCSRWEAINAVTNRDGVLELNHFKKLKKLGFGSTGTVFLAELRDTDCYFAVKVMDKESLGLRKKLDRVETEREIMQLLDHPFLPTLYCHFETEKFSYLVMDYCRGGDLHTLRQRQPGGRFTERVVRFYAAEVLVALEYLHVLGVVYRDLKPENVLIMEDGHIMLADFDLSRKLDVHPDLMELSGDPRRYFVEPQGRHDFFTDGADRKSTAFCKSACGSIPLLLPRKSKKEKKVSKKDAMSKMALIAEPKLNRCMSFVGTLEYLAPEIIAEKGHGSAVDWWTFGIFLYELLFGKTPFKDSGYHPTLQKVVDEALTFPESPNVSYEIKDLIKGLLVKDPTRRLASKSGSPEIKLHPFFRDINWALVRHNTRPPFVPKTLEDSGLATASTEETTW